MIWFSRLTLSTTVYVTAFKVPHLQGLMQGPVGRVGRHPLADGKRVRHYSGLYRKKGWSLWRRRLWEKRQKQNYKRGHVRARGLLREFKTTETDEATASSSATSRIQSGGKQWKFTVSQLKLSRKNLALIKKLIQNLHIQDAIDWLCAIPRARINPIYDDLVAARDRIALEYGGDPGRLYLKKIVVEQGSPVRYCRYALRNVYTTYRSWRNRFHYHIVQLPLTEFFKRVYVKGKVPRSLAFDMRLALKEKRAPRYMLEEWQPYICSLSRQLHRRRLLFKDRTKTLRLRQVQREWITQYQSNIFEHENDQRRQRGLQPFSLHQKNVKSSSL